MPERMKVVIAAKETDTVWLFLLPFASHLREQGHQVTVIAGEGRYAAQLREQGFETELVAFAPSINPLRLLTMIRDTTRLLRQIKPDMLIANDPSASFVSRIAAWIARVPSIVYFCHGFPAAPHSPPFGKLVFRSLEGLVRPLTDAIVTMNEADHAYAVPRYRKTYRISGVGVDTARWAVEEGPPAEAMEPRRPLTVGFVGRLIEQKGVLDFLDAAESLRCRAEAGAFRFVIAGDGPLRPHVARRVERSGEAGPEYHGYVDDPREFIGSLDVLVLPTYYPEGLPRVILEAMAMGVPVIASRTRGCVDLVADRITGWLVEPRCPELLAETIAEVAARPDERRRMAKEAGRRVREGFSTEVTVGQFAQIIADLGPA